MLPAPAIFALLLIVGNAVAFPSSTDSLIVSSDGSPKDKSGKESQPTNVDLTIPQIYKMHVQSDVSNRFAKTTVTSKVKNFADRAKEATFSVVLPENAFISGFIMEVDGKNYTAYVKEKEEAKRTYDEAVSSGLAAAHVAVSARDSNRFTVSVNIEPESKAAFYLSYEELLQRKNSQYELIINLHPGQPVEDLDVEVFIAESRKLTVVKAPPLRSGNEIGNERDELDPRADIEIVNNTSAIIKFSPNLERQKQMAHLMGTKENEGLSGQFVVQYEVERDPQGGEVLIQDGYFVHFFAPSELTSLPKHVVFVLDTSSSMYGQKIQQLREAMLKILDQLNDNDLFHLVEFNSLVKVWDINNPDSSVQYDGENYQYGENGIRSSIRSNIMEYSFPKATPVNSDNIKKAKSTISKLVDTGATNIHSALTIGLRLIELTREANTDTLHHQPMMIFLTDGDPTVGIASTERIIADITEMNVNEKRTPLYALSFGDGADKDFLQKLSSRNSGFSKHIYEAADAALQLEDFYKQISSPLLTNVTFKYESSATSLTETQFPILFDGSELVVAGYYDTDRIIDPGFSPCTIDAWRGRSYRSFKPVVYRTISSTERLWAYLTIKQLLKKKEVSDTSIKDLNKKALDLALKYSFVTPVSSLVVVKPNSTNAVDTEAADKAQPGINRGTGYGRPQYASRMSFGSSHFARRIDVMPMRGYDSDMPTAQPGINLGTGYGRPQYASNVMPMRGYDSPMVTASRAGPLRHHQITPLNSVDSYVSSAESNNQGAAINNPNIFATLPWLQGILNSNGTLSLSSGTYKLGLNENVSDNSNCPKTPTNTTGHCTLLSNCPSVHSLLTSVTIFEDHMCLLQNEYAGICCPKDLSTP